MSESTAVAVTWHQYLDSLDDTVRRLELEIAVHPGSFEPPSDEIDEDLPDGDMPPECAERAQEIRARMMALASIIEGQMESLTNHRIALAREIQPVFFDSRF